MTPDVSTHLPDARYESYTLTEDQQQSSGCLPITRFSLSHCVGSPRSHTLTPKWAITVAPNRDPHAALPAHLHRTRFLELSFPICRNRRIGIRKTRHPRQFMGVIPRVESGGPRPKLTSDDPSAMSEILNPSDLYCRIHVDVL